jgi:hypothetical protein
MLQSNWKHREDGQNRGRRRPIYRERGGSCQECGAERETGSSLRFIGLEREAPGFVLKIMKNKFEINVIEPLLLLKYAPDDAGLEKCRE